jgi:phosphoglycolate phosphatase-like HAD superfamily hydrolase
VTGSLDTAVLDVDGTLVDTNYQHALAWYRAFRAHDITIPLWHLHRHIGMGGDKFVGAVAGEQTEQREGDELRATWKDEFAPMLDEVAPLPRARELLETLKARDLRLVLASSGAPEHVEHYLDLLAARDLADAWTDSGDVEATKPAPDLVEVAIAKVEGARAFMVGDSIWDSVACAKIGVPSYAVRTGGFSPDELREAGAREVFDDLDGLCDALDRIVAGSGGRDVG